MAQQTLVLIVVFVALCYALWYWLPKRARQHLGRVHPALGRKPECGSCSRCGGCAGESHVDGTVDGTRPARWRPAPADQSRPD